MTPPATAQPPSSLANQIAVLSYLEESQTVSLIKRVMSDNGHLPVPAHQDLQWSIKNKYYSADVCFKIHTQDLQNTAKLLGTSPAVIVLLQDVEQADLRLLEACSSPSLEIKLLVALGTGPLLPHEVETASSLALDYEFEFVDAQALPGSVAGDASDSDEDFDVVGIPRIRDALQAHMWSESEASSAHRSSTANNLNASNMELSDKATTQEPAFEDDFSPFVTASTSSSPEPDLMHDPAAAELDDFDSLSAMLGQLKAARDHSMSLSNDQDRRDFAERATKRFLAGLGTESDSDDMDDLDDPHKPNNAVPENAPEHTPA